VNSITSENFSVINAKYIHVLFEANVIWYSCVRPM